MVGAIEWGLERLTAGTRLCIFAGVLTMPLWLAFASEQPASSEEETITPNAPSNQGIEFFDGSLVEALALAKSEDKLVFVDVYAPWCGPCIVMQETVFPLPELGDYFNTKFVSIKYDGGNATAGQVISKHAGPIKIFFDQNYLVLDSDGNELGRVVGGAPPRQFISIVSRMLGNSTSTFDAMEARYESGDRSPDFVQEYLLDSIVELAFRDFDHIRASNIDAFRNEWDKYKKRADAYFASRPYSKLINATDIQLVMFFHEKSPRGVGIVEFVIQHYDEFLGVSSESAMVQFTLGATWEGVKKSAREGDERFFEFIGSLGTSPLQRAVAYERNRDPNSRLLPERMRYSWETQFHYKRKDWQALFDIYESRIQEQGDSAKASLYAAAANALSQSDDPIHRHRSLEYGRRAYELDIQSPVGAQVYVSMLVTVEKFEEAKRVAKEYRAQLTNAPDDQRKLAQFNRVVSRLLDE